MKRDRRSFISLFCSEREVKMLESQFQSKLIREIKEKFPGSFVLKTDPNYIQGFPDLLILWGRNWACLECKREAGAAVRPNQKHYIDVLNSMGFAMFVSPETKDEVLNAVERAFKS